MAVAATATQRRIRAVSRSRADGLQIARWLVAATAVALMIASGGLLANSPQDYVDAGRSVLSQVAAFWALGWFMVTAQAALVLFTLVVATSLVMVRRRWRYESWHAVHLLVYVAIALVVPHQFLQGTTFRSKGVARWFWALLYGGVFTLWAVYRVYRPPYLASRHRLRAAEVNTHADGSTSVVMEGRSLRGLRITVNPSGDASTALAALPVGTRVLAEGPLGIFSPAIRARNGVVFVAAGIGITALRAMLEADALAAGCHPEAIHRERFGWS